MTWTLPPQTHRVFERNPLVAVVVELRFHPILQILNKVADYQDRVRATFPAFEQSNRQMVNLGPAPVEIRFDNFWTFAKADGSSVLTLSTSSLALESRRHEHREQLLDDVKVGFDALVGVFGSVLSTRLGLRYVDVIDREQIAKDLGRPTSWDRLLSQRFSAVPGGLADFEGTLFACEVASSALGGGAQTARYGLVKDVDGRAKFRLDVDRYQEGSFELNVAVPRLDAFADDIFAFFIAAAGPDLLAWMSEGKGTNDDV
ncbi:MAG TPA: TIGR04255 family protein [Polyangiaceae bacterium]|nr:TIGR04255 family protein [Polyangiaceae bacterium]